MLSRSAYLGRGSIGNRALDLSRAEYGSRLLDQEVARCGPLRLLFPIPNGRYVAQVWHLRSELAIDAFSLSHSLENREMPCIEFA